MNHHAKAPSAGSTTRQASRLGRGLFGFACLCVLGLAAFLGSGAPSATADSACPNEALRVEQHATFLPDCRAYEMVSPPGKNGADVMPNTVRTHAAAEEAPGLPMAATFASLGGFGDVAGTGVSTEYLSQRSTAANPGDNGWSTHAITPTQEPLPVKYNSNGFEPAYVELAPNLNGGVFAAGSPLTADPNVAQVANLYSRPDLRTAGPGTYQLGTACPLCESTSTPLPPLVQTASRPFPVIAGSSADPAHFVFESMLKLTPDATADIAAGNPNLYESDHGAVRLTGILPNGTAAAESIAGQGAGSGNAERSTYTPHSISADGRRIFFTAEPMTCQIGLDAQTCGGLYMREPFAGPARTVQLNASEKEAPEAPQPAVYWDASADGSKVFFTTAEKLTDDDPNSTLDLYMYDAEHLTTEAEALVVKATTGTFTLTFGAQTTAPLPFGATAAEVQAALDALSTIGGAGGSVTVSGGPGDAAGTAPYTIVFGGSLAEADAGPITADATGLGGGTAALTLLHAGGGHLTRLSVRAPSLAGQQPRVDSVFGISDNGDYVYFAASKPLVAGQPALTAGQEGLFLWHRGADTPPAGKLTFIAKMLHYAVGDNGDDFIAGSTWVLGQRQSRVSPDGHHLLFASSNGTEELSLHGGSDYDHGSCPNHAQPEGGCSELYLYDAATDQLQCASCNPSGAVPTANATDSTTQLVGASKPQPYLNHPLSADGRYVFFSTTEALLSADTNGVSDAYAYDSQTGQLHLLSTGTSPTPSYFMDASADGKDAFIATRQQLLGWDNDGSYDLYDVRVNGGFPEPAALPAACSGDTCRAAGPAAEAQPTPGSAVLTGPGNPKPHRNRHHRKHHAKRHHVRHERNKGKKHKHRAKKHQRKGTVNP